MGMPIDEMLNIFLEETGEKRENITEYTRIVSIFLPVFNKTIYFKRCALGYYCKSYTGLKIYQSDRYELVPDEVESKDK